LLEIELNRGRQFDPTVSDIFLIRFSDILDDVLKSMEPEYII